MYTKNLYLETYQKQDELMHILTTEKLAGRPSKYYKIIHEYLHNADIIHIMDGDTIYNNHNEVINYIQYISCAGRINLIYNNLN